MVLACLIGLGVEVLNFLFVQGVENSPIKIYLGVLLERWSYSELTDTLDLQMNFVLM